MSYLPILLTTAAISAMIDDDGALLGPVEIAAMGLTNTPFTASPSLTGIPGEIKRIPVSGGQVGDDILHMTALDSSDDAYEYSGFGIYLSDGTLFASYSQPTAIAAKASMSNTYIAVDIQLEASYAAAVTFGDTNFANPTPATADAAVLDYIGYTPLDADSFVGAQILLRLHDVDGADSDLDADKLDGHHASDFPLLSAFDSGSNEHGYWRKTPDGRGGSIIEQWGSATALDPWSGDLAFPIPFTDFESINIVAVSSQNDNTASDGNALHARKLSITTFQIGSDDNAKTVFWRAIGK